VPDDFVIFDDVVHTRLLKELETPGGGVKVLFGTPGCGKSTYLSFLYAELRKRKRCALRHHYFLAMGDQSQYERLSYDRCSESLIYDLLDQAPTGLLRKLTIDPRPDSLPHYLLTAAEYFANNQAPLVLIIDGLDHVTRERGDAELRQLLGAALSVKKGLWLVLGTRPLPSDVLPRAIYDSAPDGTWIEVKGLGLDGCRKLLHQHVKECWIADNLDLFERILQAFYQKTEGHPLHCHYTVEYLRERATSGPIWEQEVLNVPPYGGNIVAYYHELQRRLSYEASEVAELLAACGFPLTRPQILECLDPAGQRTPGIQNGISQIRHLAREGVRGLEIFHSSFVEFLRSTDSYNEAKRRTLEKLRDWLKGRAGDSARWSHLNRVEYQLGNSDAVLGTLSRDWVIASLVDFRPYEQVYDQLRLGTHAAMLRDDFAKALNLGLLASYLSSAPEFCADVWEKIWALTWRLDERGTPILPDPEELAYVPTDRLVLIARRAAADKNKGLLSKALKIMNERAGRWRPVRREEIMDRWSPEARALACVAALVRAELPSVLEWASAFRNIDRTSDVLDAYASELWQSSQWMMLGPLMQSNATPAEKCELLDTFCRAAIKSGRKDLLDSVLSSPSKPLGPWTAVYLSLSFRAATIGTGDLPALVRFPESAKDYASNGEREAYRGHFLEIYLFGLAAGIARKQTAVSKWIAATNKNNWAQNAASLLAEMGITHGNLVAGGRAPTVDSILLGLAGLMVPTFGKYRDLWVLGRSFRDSLVDVLDAAVHVGRWVEPNSLLSLGDVELLRKSPFFSRMSVLKFLIGTQTLPLNLADAQRYLAEEKSFMQLEIRSFAERSEYYADLATIALKNKLNEEAKQLVRLAAANIFGYGGHKDLHLHFTVESVDACCEAGSKSGPDWLRRLAPLIEHVREYTDGDETRHLPSKIAKSLLKIQPARLGAYYTDVASREEFFLADDIFPELLASLDLSNRLNAAIACTAVDLDSIDVLKSRSTWGDAAAASVVQKLSSIFHCLPSPRPDSSPENKGGPIIGSQREPEVDVETIMPQKFAEYVSEVRSPYEQGQRVRRWANVWLQKPERIVAYKMILGWIYDIGAERVEGGVYDLLVEFALSVGETEDAFDFLCKAQEQGHGWSPFWGPGKQASRRADVIKREFPSRWREFIKMSLKGHEFGFPPNCVSSLPIPIGTEFLIRIGELPDAEKLTEAAVQFAEDLMANLKLPAATWIATDVSPDGWDILFSRLLSPSPVVRERAASELAELLTHATLSAIALDRLSSWMESVRLESIIPLALLAVVKASRRQPFLDAVQLQKLSEAIKVPSLISQHLLEDIRRRLRST
jgi:hypothetical protein